MGMCAEIIAIGPFTKEIAAFLEYPSKLYAGLSEGTIITERLFGIMEGSSLSKEFANLIGISNPWDFSQHKIKIENIDINGLKKFVDRYNDYEDDLIKFIILKDNGFEFHFRPEG